MSFSNVLEKLNSLVKGGNPHGLLRDAKQTPQSTGLPIAIDFGSSCLKVLQLQAGESPSLVGAATAEVPEELRTEALKRLEYQFKALPRLVKASGLKGRRAVCAIPAWATVCKHFQLSKSSEMSLEQLVEMQIPTQLNCDPSRISYRILEVTPPNASKPEVIVMAVSQDLVKKLMDAISASKLDPVGMHSEFTAMLHAFDYLHKRDSDVNVNTLYLDIGMATTCVAISHGKKLAFARVIELGGYSLDEQLSRQLNCTVKEARKRRWQLNEGIAPAASLSMAAKSSTRNLEDLNVIIDRREGLATAGLGGTVNSMDHVDMCPPECDLSESIDILTDEVRMCLRFHYAQFPDKKVERVIFIGGEARHRGLCQQIAKALKLPAQIADPFSRIIKTGKEELCEIDITKPQPGWAVALGLCLAPTDL